MTDKEGALADSRAEARLLWQPSTYAPSTHPIVRNKKRHHPAGMPFSMDVRCFEQQNMHFGKRLLFIAVFQNVFFDCGEAFRADDMLHAAGITDGCLGIDAELNQPAGNQFMTFINHFSNLAAGIGQIDKPFFGYGNMVLFA